MKSKPLTHLALAVLFAATGSIASAQTARVTEAVNQVSHGSHESSATTPAQTGTTLHDGEYLRTGVKSRAELQLPSQSITRLGADTIFNYSVASNTVDLQAGTILFCKPKTADQLNLKTAAVTAGITGTTGFVSVDTIDHQKTYIVGIIEGHATVRANGQGYPLNSGDIIEFRPPTHPLLFSFDVPRMVRTSIFFTKFKGRLPNQSYIDKEVASYLDDQRRGFIQPPSHAIDYSGDIPTVSTTAFDSASNSQGQGKGAPPPPPPPPPSSFNPGR